MLHQVTRKVNDFMKTATMSHATSGPPSMAPFRQVPLNALIHPNVSFSKEKKSQCA